MTATATVRSLLEEVHTEQSQVPDELVEWMSLHDIRWHLERIVALQPTSDAVESTAALKAVSDDQLEVIVDMCGEWHKAAARPGICGGEPGAQATSTRQARDHRVHSRAACNGVAQWAPARAVGGQHGSSRGGVAAVCFSRRDAASRAGRQRRMVIHGCRAP